MSKRIVKVHAEDIYPVLGRMPNEVLLARDLPLGKVSLSIKVGKRRRLVSGRITSEMEDDSQFGLSYRNYFTPNNPQKMDLLT